jgi:DNA-binding transcriptional ArsR family regulator
MPTEVAPASTESATRVRVSALIELQFSLFIIERCATADVPGKWTQTWVAPFMEHHRPLADAVAHFWGDGAPPEWGELLVYADLAGVLFSEDLDGAWPRLERVASRPIVVPPLPAEEPEVRPLIQARVDRLSASAEERTRYFRLLRDVWAILEPSWRGWGRATALGLVERVRQELPKHADPRNVLPPNHFARRAEGCGLAVSPAIDRGEMVIVPMGLGGVGYALFAVPGIVIAAFGPDAQTRVKHRRDLAEAAATRFKVFSDPTRNAILGALLQTPQSITEIADAFQLSQPTVSVHMKMLRESNLLTAQKSSGGQTLYCATEDGVKAFVNEATVLLTTDCP